MCDRKQISSSISDKTPVGRRSNWTGVAALAAVLVAALPPAQAADDGPTQVGNVCMQKVYGTPVSSSNQLNCTANDIRLSRAVSVSQGFCTRGEVFDLTATFETVVTANSRYDAGFFFRVDGGGSARGDGALATGSCSLSALDSMSSDAALNLDGDSAGDLNAGTYGLTFTIPGVECVDRNGDGFLDLPNCTSWHSNQGTVGTVGEPFDYEDALTFHPDTKSKCVCDDTFQVPVRVEAASIKVEKSPSPSSLFEPGGEFTFNVTIINTASIEAVQIQSITDNKHPDEIAQSDCKDLIGTMLPANGQVTCSFKADVWGNAGYSETDRVTVTAYQPSMPLLTAYADATVTIEDLVEDKEPTLDKKVLTVGHCALEATYQVVVSNTSTVDSLTIRQLTDDTFGDVTMSSVDGPVIATECSLPQVVATNSNYTCEFVARVKSTNCNFTHTNTIEADVIDDDGIPFAPRDGAQVVVKVETP